MLVNQKMDVGGPEVCLCVGLRLALQSLNLVCLFVDWHWRMDQMNSALQFP